MPISEAILQKVFESIDGRQDEWVKILREAVAIPSVSSKTDRRMECKQIVQWTKKALIKLRALVETIDPGVQILPDGSELPLPPIICAQLLSKPKKPTLLVYGHLDVQPAAKKASIFSLLTFKLQDGWKTKPFNLAESGGNLYGRGVADGKGSFLVWLHAVSVLVKLKIKIPVNLKFVFECMKESGSEGLESVLEKKKHFLKGVDFVCVASANCWLKKSKPWLGDSNDGNFKAGIRAIKRVIEVEPDFTREGEPSQVELILQKITGKPVINFPIGTSDAISYAQNEKLNRSDYVKAIKVIAAFLLELKE